MPDQNALNIAALILAGLLGCAGLLLAAGQLFHAVKQTRGEESRGQVEDARFYADRLERIGRETVEALRTLTEEMRLSRTEMMAAHRDNLENFREVRDAIRDFERRR